MNNIIDNDTVSETDYNKKQEAIIKNGDKILGISNRLFPRDKGKLYSGFLKNRLKTHGNHISEREKKIDIVTVFDAIFNEGKYRIEREIDARPYLPLSRSPMKSEREYSAVANLEMYLEKNSLKGMLDIQIDQLTFENKAVVHIGKIIKDGTEYDIRKDILTVRDLESDTILENIGSTTKYSLSDKYSTQDALEYLRDKLYV